MEMRSRRKILLLHGLPEQKDEDTTASVLKVLVSKLRLTNFSNSDISRCHRMGRLTSLDKPRPILLKLREHNTRNKVWSDKSCLKGTGVTLSEFLTKPRHQAFMAARQKFGMTRCRTRDGVIFVMGTGYVRHRIHRISELDKISVPITSKPITSIGKESATTSKGRRAGAVSKK